MRQKSSSQNESILLAKRFHWAVSAAAAAALVYSIHRLQLNDIRFDWMAALTIILLFTWRADLWAPTERSRSFLTNTLVFISMLVLGSWAATVLASVGGLARYTGRDESAATLGRDAAALNLAALGAATLTAATFGPLDQLVSAGNRLEELAIAMALASVVYYLINAGIEVAGRALQRGGGLAKMWAEDYLWRFTAVCGAALAAGLMSKAIVSFGFYVFVVVLLALLTAYGVYKAHLVKVERSKAHIEELARLHLATIESLTMAIEAKDQAPRGHIRRVRQLAEGLARAVGYPEEQMEGLKAAAILRDIGNLAIPEHILNKPGKLNSAEQAKVMVHPVVGADILSSVEFPYEVVPIVKHHHEKYDGTGYPNGLAGEQIPLGARIIAIVDCYDALMTPRAYRPAYPREQALEIMRCESGRAFDPTLLEKFFGMLDALEASLPPLGPFVAPLAGVESGPSGPVVEHNRALPPRTRTEKALRNITTAQREVLSLYEIAHTLGSTLKLSEVLLLVGTKLENIANFTTLVIYLAEGTRLRAAHAVGRDAEALMGAEIEFGEGSAGWVAEHHQVLIGGNPLTDLERRLGHQAAAYCSTAIFPLLREGALVGALALYSEQDRGYSADEVRLLETIAAHAAAALHNALMFERTRESALTDNLTGLPNSRYMYSFFDQERSRAERHGYALVIMMMDLDGFKKVNDTYGHHIGDEILRHIAGVARAQLRGSDTLIRYAGDEFVAVLHRATPEFVLDLKKRLQSAIDNFAYEVRPGREARVGVSVGHATYGEDGHTIEELMEVADERMYEDKAARKRETSPLRLANFPAKNP
ncbi:MAG TPA: diguanylate cyclase [Blastocatellia bacterium]|nr:diguanylate cyclase [Blastocatellia bacterium]